MPYVKLISPGYEYEIDGRTLSPGRPVNLSVEQRKSLEDRGFVFEKSSKSEAEESVESDEALPVGEDVESAGPAFYNTGDDPNQDQPGNLPPQRDK